MTIESLFDLVAPIAIYHRADVCFKKQASKAWSKIKKVARQEWLQADCAAPDVSDKLDDLNDWAKDNYDVLFLAIVQSDYPDWKSFFDKYGAKGIKDGQGREVFTGDSGFEFPWYETAELLVNRLDEHRRDYEENDEDFDD